MAGIADISFRLRSQYVYVLLHAATMPNMRVLSLCLVFSFVRSLHLSFFAERVCDREQLRRDDGQHVSALKHKHNCRRHLNVLVTCINGQPSHNEFLIHFKYILGVSNPLYVLYILFIIMKRSLWIVYVLWDSVPA